MHSHEDRKLSDFQRLNEIKSGVSLIQGLANFQGHFEDSAVVARLQQPPKLSWQFSLIYGTEYRLQKFNAICRAEHLS